MQIVHIPICSLIVLWVNDLISDFLNHLDFTIFLSAFENLVDFKLSPVLLAGGWEDDVDESSWYIVLNESADTAYASILSIHKNSKQKA